MASRSKTSPSIEAEATTNSVSRVLTPILETELDAKYPIAVTFHPDADLKVVVQVPDADPVVYMVCASALSCASREWRRMLYHDAASAHDSHARDDEKQGQIFTMRLEGNAEALGVVFRIVHYDFAYAPQEPTVDQLFELSKIACQYHCAHVLHPWVGRWTSRLRDFATQDNCFTECHKALYIGWALGDLQLYRDAIDTFIVSSKLNADGKIVNISGQLLEHMLLPPCALDIIAEIRATTVAKILTAVKVPIEAISSGGERRGNIYCKVGKDKEACEIMMLGSAVSALVKAQLFPIPDAVTFTGSIEDLKDGLESIKLVPYVGKDWLPHTSHGGCDLGFSESVTTCLKGMVVPLSSHIMSWMSNQADICGTEATHELKEWRLKSHNATHLPGKKFQEGCGSDSGSITTKEQEEEETGQ